MSLHQETPATRDGDMPATPLGLQISNAMTRLVSDYTGRGPTRARTTINGSLVVCLLEDSLTKGERMLVDNGQLDAVLQMRASFQQAMAEEAISAVEGLTGRPVVAFMSTNHADPDYGAEIFVLGDVTDAPAHGSDPVSERASRSRA